MRAALLFTFLSSSTASFLLAPRGGSPINAVGGVEGFCIPTEGPVYLEQHTLIAETNTLAKCEGRPCIQLVRQVNTLFLDNAAKKRRETFAGAEGSFAPVFQETAVYDMSVTPAVAWRWRGEGANVTCEKYTSSIPAKDCVNVTKVPGVASQGPLKITYFDAVDGGGVMRFAAAGDEPVVSAAIRLSYTVENATYSLYQHTELENFVRRWEGRSARRTPCPLPLTRANTCHPAVRGPHPCLCV